MGRGAIIGDSPPPPPEYWAGLLGAYTRGEACRAGQRPERTVTQYESRATRRGGLWAGGRKRLTDGVSG